MPKRDTPNLPARLLIGGLAGVVATMALTGAMRRLRDGRQGRGPSQQSGEVALVVTFAYGAACGAVLAVVNPRVGRFAGSAAGAGLWLMGQMGWLPPLGVGAPATERSLRHRVSTLGAHLAWGRSAAAAIGQLDAVRVAFQRRPPRA